VEKRQEAKVDKAQALRLTAGSVQHTWCPVQKGLKGWSKNDKAQIQGTLFWWRGLTGPFGPRQPYFLN